MLSDDSRSAVVTGSVMRLSACVRVDVNANAEKWVGGHCACETVMPDSSRSCFSMNCVRDVVLRPKSPMEREPARADALVLCIVGVPRSEHIARFSNLIYALKEADAKCTFFLQWHVVKTQMSRSFYTVEIAKLIALNGHTIAIDMATPLCSGSAKTITIELMEAMQYVLAVYGQTARFVRMGLVCIDGETQKVLEKLGLQAISCQRSTATVWIRNDERLVSRVYELMADAVADKQKLVTLESFYDEIH